jgi:hypothetical protein
MMMLAPIGYAMIEFARVPLAISARAHASRTVRCLAVLGIVCAAGVTTKSMSQPGEVMFRPRLFDAVHAAEALQVAKDAQATMLAQIAAADDQVNKRRQELSDAEARAKDAPLALRDLPKDQCHVVSGTTTDGRPFSRQVCKSDSRIGALRDNLTAAIATRETASKRLTEALAIRELDRAEVDAIVSAKTKDYREAVMHSQIHSFTAMFFGIAPTEVSDERIHQFLRLFVFAPAIFVAFASTLIALTAVHKLPPRTVPFHPDGFEYLLSPIYQHAVNEAVRQVRDQHRAEAAALKVPA